MSSLTEIIANFSAKKILVIGDAILDQYVWGNVDRISPEAPVPVVAVVKETCRLGGAANVAANICSLGGKVNMVSVVGNDENGDKLSGMLSDIGADVGGIIRCDNRPTIVKTRVIAYHQHVVRIDREAKNEMEGDVRGEIIARAKGEIPNVDAVLISDYDKGVITKPVLDEIIGTGRKYDKPVVIDPKIRNFWNYTGAMVLTPNLKEVCTAVGMGIVDEEDLLRAGNLILKKLDLQALLITQGERGMTLFQANGQSTSRVDVTHIPAVAREVFDVTGAGDTVAAVFTLSLVSGADFAHAAGTSNYAAGITVGEVGTACVTPEELSSFIRQYKMAHGPYKILS